MRNPAKPAVTLEKEASERKTLHANLLMFANMKQQ